MKKTILFFTLALLVSACCPKANAQAPTEKITVNASDLTAQQLAKIKTDQELQELEKKVETYGKWVGVGNEVGVAVKESLSAVVDVADKFGKTEVGKFTLVMVAWKIMGKDIVRIIIGLIFIIVSTWFIIYSFRTTCIERKVMLKNPGFLKYPKEYQVVQPRFGNGEGLGIIRWLHLIAFFASFWISYGIMFA